MNTIRDQGTFKYEIAEAITLEEFLRDKNT
jgi:hypothetical protein